MLAPLLLIAGGVLNAWLGYLICYRRYYGLIAGYDPRRVRNPERLARWVGGWSMLLGAVCMVSSVAIFVVPARRHLVLQIFAALAIGCVTAMLGGSSRRARG